MLKVYTQQCNDPDLIVTALESTKDKINDAVTEYTILKVSALESIVFGPYIIFNT